MMPDSDSSRDRQLTVLLEELADLDAAESAGLSPDDCLSRSDVKNLKVELDAFAQKLRHLPPDDPYQEEFAFRRALGLVEAMVGKPSTVVMRSPKPLPTAELGTLGQYELLSVLGQGAMGTVYKALHTKLDKVVAVKVLRLDRFQDEHAVARFDREMRAVAKMEHPHIVRATDAGESDGKYFLVMEYLDGIDLSHLIRHVGPPAIADACELLRQAAMGLQYAHSKGMVHRDVKPSNLILARSEDGP